MDGQVGDQLCNVRGFHAQPVRAAGASTTSLTLVVSQKSLSIDTIPSASAAACTLVESWWSSWWVVCAGQVQEVLGSSDVFKFRSCRPKFRLHLPGRTPFFLRKEAELFRSSL